MTAIEMNRWTDGERDVKAKDLYLLSEKKHMSSCQAGWTTTTATQSIIPRIASCITYTSTADGLDSIFFIIKSDVFVCGCGCAQGFHLLALFAGDALCFEQCENVKQSNGINAKIRFVNPLNARQFSLNVKTRRKFS